MAEELSQIIAQAVAKAPEWIRKELSSVDAGHRARAEDAMAAIVAAALSDNRAAPTALAEPD